MTLLTDATEVVVPVGRPGDLGVLASDQGLGPGHREVITKRCIDQRPIIVGPRLVVVGKLGLHRRREDPQQLADSAAGLQLEPAAAVEGPAASPSFLIFITAGVALAGPGLHIVEPDVLGAGTISPRLLAGHRTRMAANALVKVHHHAHLGHHPHQYCTSWERRRMVETMSRWLPVGPR